MTVSHDGSPAGPDGGSRAPDRRRFGRIGAGLAGAGAVLGVVAFTALPWLSQDRSSKHFADPSSQSRFGGLHAMVDRLQHEMQAVSGHVHFGVAPAYFSWLGWTLLAVAAVLALLAVAPAASLGRATTALRVLAGLVALTGVGLTVWALDVFTYDRWLGRYLGVRSASFGDYLAHGYVGFWAALLAFVLIGAAALVGPRRPHAVDAPVPVASRPAQAGTARGLGSNP